jgi:hypothetical protein
MHHVSEGCELSDNVANGCNAPRSGMLHIQYGEQSQNDVFAWVSALS